MKAKAKTKSMTGKQVPVVVVPPDVDGILSTKQIVFMLDISLRKFKQMLSVGEYPRHDFALGKLHRWTVATHNQWIKNRKSAGGGGGRRQ